MVSDKPETVIEVRGVYKNFKLPHEKTNSIKSFFTGITKKEEKQQGYEIQRALDDISFDVKKGEFFGIVGRNGSGKSTLLKILAQIYQPTKGTVKVRGKLVPFIELGVGFNPELSGRENVYLNGALLGFTRKEIDKIYPEIVEFAELERFMDQKLKNYSSGMQVRLAFSVATHAEADILLVDEVLAVGDADFQRKCFDYFRSLKRKKKTVIFVSHDMNAVREYCDRAVLIEQSKIVLEDKPIKVSNAYTKMFIKEEEVNTADAATANEGRWGDKKITYEKVTLSSNSLTDDDKNVTLRADLVVNEGVERPVFGFMIKDSSGFQLMGINNDIKQQSLDSLQKGDVVSIGWEIPNMFSDGKHYIDIAAEYGGGHKVSDRWEEALDFHVYKIEKTPYIVSPPVQIDMKVTPNPKGKMAAGR